MKQPVPDVVDIPQLGEDHTSTRRRLQIGKNRVLDPSPEVQGLFLVGEFLQDADPDAERKLRDDIARDRRELSPPQPLDAFLYHVQGLLSLRHPQIPFLRSARQSHGLLPPRVKSGKRLVHLVPQHDLDIVQWNETERRERLKMMIAVHRLLGGRQPQKARADVEPFFGDAARYLRRVETIVQQMEQLLYTELFFDIITLDINVSFRVGCFACEDGVKSLKARMRASLFERPLCFAEKIVSNLIVRASHKTCENSRLTILFFERCIVCKFHLSV